MAINYKGKHAYTGSIATRYDQDRVMEQLWAVEQDYVKNWVAGLPQQALLLDVPVGTGRFLDVYCQQRIRVLGVDISADMVTEACRKLGGSRGWCELSVGDAENLLLPDQSVDYIICWRLAHLLPAPVLGRVLSEFRRVARIEIVLEVLSIEDEVKIWRLRKLKSWLRPLWLKLKLQRSDVPWSHITNYGYTITEITSLILQANLAVRSKSVIKTDSGQSAMIFHLCSA